METPSTNHAPMDAGDPPTVLVTGGAGFIGYHVAKALRARGDAVVALDNFNPYYDPKLKRARAALLTTLGVEVVEGDVGDAATLEALWAKHGFTRVVHLAAQAGVRHSLEQPQTYVRDNVAAFVTLLEALRARPTVPLVYASSSSVYGQSTAFPYAETDAADRPASLYAATKRANELMAHAYHHLFGLRVTGLRFFTVYGPWGRPDMAYVRFAERMLRGEPITLFNQGEMHRDFTYVDDIVRGVVAAVDLGAPCELVNLGGDACLALPRFVLALERALGVTAQIVHAPMQPGDVVRTAADLGKARALLDYAPTTSIDEGMRRFATWYAAWRAGGTGGAGPRRREAA